MGAIDVDSLFISLRSWIDPKDCIKQMARWSESDFLEYAVQVVQALDGKSLSPPSELLGKAIDVAFELERRYPDLRELQFQVYKPPPTNEVFSINGNGVIPYPHGNDGLSFGTFAD
ncbi:hypothetical protein BC829DRAFT_436156 [Chytridium lagenaria]|nr:hypothetical protein BC829DRAFT_436156 [Chytridium lagenaria]